MAAPRILHAAVRRTDICASMTGNVGRLVTAVAPCRAARCSVQALRVRASRRFMAVFSRTEVPTPKASMHPLVAKGSTRLPR